MSRQMSQRRLLRRSFLCLVVRAHILLPEVDLFLCQQDIRITSDQNGNLPAWLNNMSSLSSLRNNSSATFLTSVMSPRLQVINSTLAWTSCAWLSSQYAMESWNFVALRAITYTFEMSCSRSWETISFPSPEFPPVQTATLSFKDGIFLRSKLRCVIRPLIFTI